MTAEALNALALQSAGPAIGAFIGVLLGLGFRKRRRGGGGGLLDQSIVLTAGAAGGAALIVTMMINAFMGGAG
ncbi:MAG: hypothetical protein WAO69_02130 [Aestuariivita sp.]|uniref:hypothetical protein n=1 Tax=Aestuariivita sp. TaxID=1872407 RepID=UPI003BAFA2D9